MKIIFKLIIFFFVLQSCDNKTVLNKEKQKTQERKINTDKANKKSELYTDTFEFEYYNDNGDYTWLSAKKGHVKYDFVNDNNTQRNLLRGDVCEIIWKKDTIYIASEGETPKIENWLVSIKKIKDGNVSKFRKDYKKELKYYYSDKGYTQSTLDDLYLSAEYYIANTKNELIKLAIQNKEQLEYSIESRTENNRDYQVLGIGYTFEHKFNVIQWLYIDIETQKIYEYDVANDKLVEFK
ncbi:hypothetical protein [Riemerella anatipestifer]|uniref:Uncharacterized protein n=1 Tax=Riemerella anatipestifer RA-CH-1 TaxID=1228997 RepID=J9QZ14_RIEAN|nr:hypothetical protein [Riemerella anatipestifer]AFR35830.1 hypothetical protein B739_1232 [Riemerella anatipestifer RA-CH-1]AIH02881.1 hypothetical protein M949_1714 [Riemerella anatipestifer CH3]MCO7331030.1 hypothetical protein [Riemerella anatipestifer]MCO7349920.1 hypothetical protein [Riemerella anatipestifer]MCU7581659.1 hypothetical protein [Riemerella anatipestifer]